eukprot:701407-Rhodomonas_salina.1
MGPGTTASRRRGRGRSERRGGIRTGSTRYWNHPVAVFHLSPCAMLPRMTRAMQCKISFTRRQISTTTDDTTHIATRFRGRNVS